MTSLRVVGMAWLLLSGPTVSGQPERTPVLPLGNPVRVLGEAEGKTFLSWPVSMDTDREGNLWVLDAGNQRIVKFDSTGKMVCTIGRMGEGPGEFRFRPRITNTGIVVAARGKVYVLDNQNMRVTVFDSAGLYLTGFRLPFVASDMVVDNSDSLHIASFQPMPSENMIGVFDPSHTLVRTYCPPLVTKASRDPVANELLLAVDALSRIWIGYAAWPVLRVYDSSHARFARFDLQRSLFGPAGDFVNFRLRPEDVPDRSGKTQLGRICNDMFAYGQGVLLITGNFVTQIDSGGTPVRRFAHPHGQFIHTMALDEKQDLLYAADWSVSIVRCYRIPGREK